MQSGRLTATVILDIDTKTTVSKLMNGYQPSDSDDKELGALQVKPLQDFKHSNAATVSQAPIPHTIKSADCSIDTNVTRRGRAIKLQQGQEQQQQ